MRRMYSSIWAVVKTNPNAAKSVGRLRITSARRMVAAWSKDLSRLFFALDLELHELFVGGGELALETGRDEADVIEGLEVGILGGEDAGLEGGGTFAAPLDGDDVVDEVGFDGVEGHIGVLEVGLEATEFFFVLVGEEEGFVGGESVFDGVLRRAGLALFGAGSG